LTTPKNIFILAKHVMGECGLDVSGSEWGLLWTQR